MATESKDNSQSKVFVGIDVATRSWAISIISQEGELLERINIEAECEILKKILNKYCGAEIHSVYEAGRWGFHLHRQLESLKPWIYHRRFKIRSNSSIEGGVLPHST